VGVTAGPWAEELAAAPGGAVEDRLLLMLGDVGVRPRARPSAPLLLLLPFYQIRPWERGVRSHPP